MRTLGPFLSDFSNLKMRFTLNGKKYQLKGETPKSLAVPNPSKLQKSKRKQGALVQLCSIHMAPSSTITDPQKELPLDEYADILEDPKELTHRRT